MLLGGGSQQSQYALMEDGRSHRRLASRLAALLLVVASILLCASFASHPAQVYAWTARSAVMTPVAEFGEAGQCQGILKQGMYDYTSKVLSSSSQYKTLSMLKAFSDEYTYKEYQRDWRSSSHDPDYAFNPNFDLVEKFSIGLKYSTTGRTSAAQFKQVMSAIEAARSYLGSETKSAAAQTGAAKSVSTMVDPEVRRMFADCLRLANGGIDLQLARQPDGRVIDITLKHILGSGQDNLATRPNVFRLYWSPQSAVNCSLSSGPLPAPAYPLSMAPGVSYSFHCERETSAAAPGAVDITVATSGGTFQATLPELAPQQRSKEEALESTINEMRIRFERLKQTQAANAQQLQHLAGRVGRLVSKVRDVGADEVHTQDELDQFRNKVLAAFRHGACSLCESCGGKFPWRMESEAVPNVVVTFYAGNYAGQQCELISRTRERHADNVCCVDSSILS